MGAGHSNSIKTDEPTSDSQQDDFTDEESIEEHEEDHSDSEFMAPINITPFAQVTATLPKRPPKPPPDGGAAGLVTIPVTEATVLPDLFPGMPQPDAGTLSDFNAWIAYLMQLFEYLAHMYDNKLLPQPGLTMEKFGSLADVTKFPLHTWTDRGGIHIIKYLRNELTLAKETFTADFQFGFISHDSYRFNKVQVTAAMLAMTIQTFSRIFAEWLGDIRSAEHIGMLLIRHLKLPLEFIGHTMSEDLEDENHFQQVLQAFLLRNPVARCLHLELHPILAAQMICAAANEAGIDPIKLFAMYCQKFLVEIAAFEGKYQEPENPFDTSFSTGIYSSTFAGIMLELKVRPPGSPARYDFSKQAEAKLALILAELPKASPEHIPDDDEQLAFFLQEVSARDHALKSARFQGAHKPGINFADRIIEGLAWQLNVPMDRALYIFLAIRDMIINAPVTVTVQLAKVLSTEGNVLTELKPVTTELSKISFEHLMEAQYYKDDPDTDETIRFTPYWEDKPGFQKRGERYRMFRESKDTAALNGFQLSPDHKPLFAALNYSFDKSMAASMSTKHIGENYYGDVHFVLNHRRLQNFMIYTATDFGIPRRDPILLLYDFLYADIPGESIIPEKQQTSTRTSDVKTLAAAALRQDFFTGTSLLKMEIQIFRNVPIQPQFIECIVLGGMIEQEKQDLLYQEYQKLHVPVKVIRKKKGSGMTGMPYAIFDFEHQEDSEHIPPPAPGTLIDNSFYIEPIGRDMDFEMTAISQKFGNDIEKIFIYWTERLNSECERRAPTWTTIQRIHSLAFNPIVEAANNNEKLPLCKSFLEALKNFKIRVKKLVPKELLTPKILSMPLDISSGDHKSKDQNFVLSVRKACDDCLKMLTYSKRMPPNSKEITELHNKITELNQYEPIRPEDRLHILMPLLILWNKVATVYKLSRIPPTG